MKKLGAILAISAMTPLTVALAEPNFPGNGWSSPQLLFKTESHNVNGYRIPSITSTSQGTLIALTDFRTIPGSDIGWPNTAIEFAYKVSSDGGNTWSEEKRLVPSALNYDQVTDPSLVHNSDTGTTFAFGLWSDGRLGNSNANSDFIVFTSNDGGNTWDKGISIKNDVLPEGYKTVFQGPGSGMYYNGTLYMAVQSWHKNGSWNPMSGYIYSNDNGKTWQSAWLPSINGTIQTSESNIFRHDGYIYLAAKPDGTNSATKRLVYRTKDNGKNWEQVQEDFIPNNVAKSETNTLSLNDKVYLVGYTLKGTATPRNEIWITTNTGKKILVSEGDTMGYTSMTQDQDNIYIFFEGGEKKGNMWFSRYDISSKDYANLNAIILKRSQNLFYIQDVIKSNTSYVKGSYGKNDETGVELLYANENDLKLGIFHAKTPENSKHVYRTIQYTSENTTLALAKDRILFDDDNIFIGYQFNKIDYANKSQNKINSLVMGYSFDHEFDNFTYKLDLNGAYSFNHFDRNKEEGLGRYAKFNSYSIGLKNALTKNLTLAPNVLTSVEGGLNTIFFNHTSFTEKGGNSWNNVTLTDSNNWSNELYVNAQISQLINVSSLVDLTLTAKATYQYELMNSDDWAENYIVLDTHRTMASPVKKYNDGFTTGTLEASFDIFRQTNIKAFASLDTEGDSKFGGVFKFTF